MSLAFPGNAQQCVPTVRFLTDDGGFGFVLRVFVVPASAGRRAETG
jgi:hypothetical protein